MCQLKPRCANTTHNQQCDIEELYVTVGNIYHFISFMVFSVQNVLFKNLGCQVLFFSKVRETIVTVFWQPTM